MNVIGKTFGRLQVLKEDPSRRGYVICKCSCGNIKSIRKTSLTKANPTLSCGCIQKEFARKNGAKTVGKNSRERLYYNTLFNTNFSVLESDKLPKNNKTGHKGVFHNTKKGIYEAYISVNRKRINLGHYKTLSDAIKAREEGEEKYFAPLIEQKRMMTQWQST